MISATSPNQEGVAGTDSRSGLDTHRDIGDTRHVYLLVGNRFVLPHQGGIFLGWFATGYISLRNSWAGGAAHVRAEAGAPLVLTTAAPFAHRPDRATERRRNLWVGLSGGCPFGDFQPLLEGGRLSAPYQRASNRTASSAIR